MKKSIFIGMLLTLSGCASITLPNGQEVESESFCGVSSVSDCSPSVGKKVALKAQQIPLEIYNGQPNIGSYLGTVISRDNDWGEPGALCGGEIKNPFTNADFVGPITTNRGEFSATEQSRRKLEAKADLEGALGKAGISQAIIKAAGVQAKIEAASEDFKNKIASTNADFVEYRIKDSVLKELETHDLVEGRFTRCLAEIKPSSGWRLYQAITATDVSQSNVSTSLNASREFELKSAIRSAGGEIDAAKFDLEFQKYRTSNSNVSSGRSFVVVGISYWLSPRHNKKW